MRWIVFVHIFLVLVACGKHESTSYGFSNTNNAKQGDKAETVEELLALSISTGEEDIFRANLELLTDINFRLKDQRTFLMESARANRALFVYLLLQKGADRTLVDDFQKTALDYATEEENQKIQFFLDESQFAKIQEDMWTAVKLLNSAPNVVKTFEAGADPNLQNEQGETVLTFLIKNLNYADKKNKAPMILKEVIEWKDAFGLTTTRASLANAAGETPLYLFEESKKNPNNAGSIDKIDGLIRRLQTVLNEEIP